MNARARAVAIVILGLTAAGCSGVQSALSPEGPEARNVANLFWIMTASGFAILVGVVVVTALAIFGAEHRRRWLSRESVIIGGGIVFPVAVLSALLLSAFYLTGAGAGPAPGGSGAALRIAVVGEQWWWRVVYKTRDGSRIESANEIRIPVGRPVALELTAADVIHSLWIPKLAGKLDMIPGRTNVLHLTANTPGVSRGQCAEYCGGAHALMSLYVVAMESAAFDAWLEREAEPAQATAEGPAGEGERLFHAAGCGACHAIRGTRANGKVAPDLTHLGSRMSLAAAALPNDERSIARWIRDNQHIKPDNRMPPYRIFTDPELGALAHYLAGLN